MTKNDLHFVETRNFPIIDGYGNGSKKNPFHIPNSAIFFIRFDIIQSLINKQFNLTNPHVKANKKSLKEIFKYI